MHTRKRLYGAGRRAVIGVFVICCVLMAVPAWAEWSFDAYLGGAFLPEGELNMRGSTGAEGAEFEDAFIVGGRLGYWFEPVPYLGVALDVSYFSTDSKALTSRGAVEEVDLSRVLLSGLARLRLPLLPSPVVPRGHLEPYVAVGPTVFVSNLDVRNVESSKEDLGLDARAGLNVRLTRTIGAFAEYRLTWVKQTFDVSLAGVRSTVETDPTTHHVLGGISFRF